MQEKLRQNLSVAILFILTLQKIWVVFKEMKVSIRKVQFELPQNKKQTTDYQPLTQPYSIFRERN